MGSFCNEGQVEPAFDSDHGTIGIPMILGVKSNLSKSLIIGLEGQHTFADDIDGIPNENLTYLKFGNINNNDWYVFSGLTLTYTFEKPLLFKLKNGFTTKYRYE
jgi:hypothetical protein